MITVKKVPATQALAKFHELVAKETAAMQEHEILTRQDLVRLGDENSLEETAPKASTINMDGFRKFLSAAAKADPDFCSEVVTTKDIELMHAESNALQQIPNGVIMSSSQAPEAVSIKDKIDKVRTESLNDMNDSTLQTTQAPRVKAKF